MQNQRTQLLRVVGHANEPQPEGEFVYYKFCTFRYLTGEERAALEIDKRMDYDDNEGLIKSHLLGELNQFIPGRDRCLVHAAYVAPFFTPMNDTVYKTSLTRVYKHLWQLVHGEPSLTKGGLYFSKVKKKGL